MRVDEAPIIVEQLFSNSIHEVWKVITNLKDMKQWFFEAIPEFKPEVGFKTTFDVTTENHIFTHVWEITEVIPQEKIVYNWKYDGFKGDSHVIFLLSNLNNKTLLTVTTIVTEDFSDEISEFKRESCLAGWNYFIKERLAQYLTAHSSCLYN